jgi:hypothetical protein
MVLSGFAALRTGFVVWIWPWIQKVYHHPVGIVTVLHGVVLWLSVVFARKLVAEALRLPPQDFELTVAACVLIFYIPIWLGFFSSLAMFYVLIDFIFAVLHWVRGGAVWDNRTSALVKHTST